MNKNRLTFVLLLVLILSMTTLAVEKHLVKAESSGTVLGVVILSPTNQTYNSKFLTLEVTFGFGTGLQYKLTYDFDGNNQGSIPFAIENPTELHVVYPANASVELPELTEGMHNITVCLEVEGFLQGQNPRYYYDSANFAVDTTPPMISDLSVENRTYYETDIPLNFTVDEITPTIVYSLDGHDNITISGNATLTGLSVGEHYITVCAWDSAGNAGLPQTAEFTVAKQIQSEQPNPILMPVIIFSGTFIVLTSVAVLFWKKRKL